MLIQNRPLKEIYADIRGKIENTLTTSEELKEIQKVIFGDSLRLGALKTPCIWIVPEPHTPIVTGGNTTEHRFTFDFVALVKNTDPEEGKKLAQDWSLTVYDVIMKDRTLGGLAFSIEPTRVDPAYEMAQGTGLYYSAVQFEFKIRRRE